MRVVGDIDFDRAQRFLSRLGLTLSLVARSEPIPGSYWGAPEAGLVDSVLFVHDNTPVHSLLHEACHYICMTAERRAELDTDAGGDDLEEAAVCYLQALLADGFPGYTRAALFQDMDDWGYSFRLGGAAAWFEEDAQDAREWLIARRLVDAFGTQQVH